MKKILLSLFGFITLGLVNFSSAGTYTYTGTYNKSISSSSSSSNGVFYLALSIPFKSYISSSNFSINCSFSNFNLSSIQLIGDSFTAVYGYTNDCNSIAIFCSSKLYNSISCSYNSDKFYTAIQFPFRYVRPNSADNVSIDYSCIFQGDNIIDQSIESDLLSCQSSLATATGNLSICQSDLNTCQNSSSCDYSGYILESEINSGYCLVNGLCPSSEICNDSDYSNLFIYSNNKYFPITGTNNIYVNLPSYLGYVYDYSNAGNDLDIDVGMVVDEDYIDGLNSVQNYKPTSEDFTELIGTLAPYSKILIFCVFLFIIWAWIKKPFKSKKL